VEEAVLEIDWYDLSTVALIIIILCFVFSMVFIEIIKSWFKK
jgi:hypothetical protein